MVTSIAVPLYRLVSAVKIAAVRAIFDPTEANKNPGVLYTQISPLINKLGLRGDVMPSKTQLTENIDTSKNYNEYRIILKKTDTLEKDFILKQKKRIEFFDHIELNNRDGIVIYLWYPYKAPAKPETPAKKEQTKTREEKRETIEYQIGI